MENASASAARLRAGRGASGSCPRELREKLLWVFGARVVSAVEYLVSECSWP